VRRRAHVADNGRFDGAQPREEAETGSTKFGDVALFNANGAYRTAIFFSNWAIRDAPPPESAGTRTSGPTLLVNCPTQEPACGG